MRRNLFLFALALCLCTNGMAEAEQTLTINGVKVQKTVSGMTFSGDDVTLQYEDDSMPETVDMSLVNIIFSYTPAAIEGLRTQESGTVTKVYSLSGQYVGDTLEGLSKGIYVVDGKKVVIK